MAIPVPVPGDYRCRDREGVVHWAYDRSWRHRPGMESDSAAEAAVDETFCGDANYMDEVDADVTCMLCLDAVTRAERDLVEYERQRRES